MNLNTTTESARIQSLKRFAILDTPPDGSFDKITKLAARLLNVPIAIVTLVDTDRIWFKSKYGIDVPQIDREPGLCASAILSDDLYLVENAAIDPRTLANPLVAGEFGLRFYAAAPLKVTDGSNLGTLCIIDKAPRTLSANEKDILQSLADILIDELELRLAARTAIYQQNQILNVAVHDLKNPLTIIPIWTELIRKKNDPETVEKMCDQISKSAKKMSSIITDLLRNAESEASQVNLRLTKTNCALIIQKVVDTNSILANKKGQQIILNIESRPLILADENKFSEIVDNLINNAIKYSSFHTKITVALRQVESEVIIEVKDEGQGFTKEDSVNLFRRFSRLNSTPTGSEVSSGLGLSIVKTVVEAHHGSIQAFSEGINKGSTFTINIPLCR